MRQSAVVGRDVELSALDGLIRAARVGPGAVVLVTGEAGVGKSTLVREALRRAPGSLLLLGRAMPGSVIAARALCEAAVGAVAAGAEPTHPSLQLLSRPLARLLGHELGRDGTDSAANRSAFDPHPLALADGLLRLVALTPGFPVLVLEDLHWADPETLEALPELSDRAYGCGLLVIMIARKTESAQLDAVFDRLAREPHIRTVTVDPLDRFAAQLMTANLIGEAVDPDLVDQLVERAEGLPLAIEQLAEVALGGGTDIPPTVAASVEARLAQLPPEHRRVITAAAVAGRTTPSGLLAEALAIPPSDIAAAVAVGAAVGLLRPSGAVGVEFGHALVRDAVYASVGAPVRRDLAEALITAADPDDHDLLARLATAAGRPELAATHYLAVASRAVKVGAPTGAEPAALRALSLSRDPRLSVGARQILLSVHAYRGDVDAAFTVANEIVNDVDPDDAVVLSAIRLALARVLASAERWPEAQQQLDLLGAQQTRTPETLALAARIALGGGNPDRAEALARNALAVAGAAPREVAGDPVARCEAYEIIGRIARTRDLDEALTWFRRASSTAYAHDMPLWRARALHELATITQLRDITVDDLRRARESAVEAGAPALVGNVDFHLAAVHGVRFEVEEAAAAGRRVLDGGRRLNLPRQQAWGWILIGQARAAAADRSEAAGCADHAVALAPNNPEIAALAVGTCRGLASLLIGDREAAIAQFAAAVDLLRPLPRTPMPPWYLWPLIALVWTDKGETALTDADAPGIRASTGADGLWHLADAVRAARAGGSSAGSLQAARAAFQRVPGFVGYAHVGYRIAAEAALTDGWGEPLRWLAEAEAWGDAHDLPGFAVQCRTLARRAGAPQRRRGRGATTVPPELATRQVTTREADVLALLALGRSNQQIADQLYLSPRTVKTHVESLLRKTGAANRTELAAIATTAGLRPPT